MILLVLAWGVMEVVSSVSELRKLMISLANRLRCGEYVRFIVKGDELLVQVPRYAIANELSITNIESCSDGYVVEVTKRFGRLCR